jgi:superfamily II DNA or RNA helicase
MFDPRLHATLVPGDPARTSCLALWSDDDASPGGPDASETPVELVELVLPGPGGVGVQLRSARLVRVDRALDALVGVAPDDTSASPSVRAWSVVARTALETIARGRLQPAISAGGFDTWAPGPLEERDRSLRAALASWLPPVAHCHPLPDHDGLRVPSAAEAVAVFSRAVADALPRTAAAATVARQPAWCGTEPVDVSTMRSHLVHEDEGVRTVVGLRLSLPDDAEEPFGVVLQVRSAVDPSQVAEAEDLWTGRAEGFDERAEADLLLALRRGARLWPPLATLLQEAEPTRLEVDDDQAMALFGPLATDLGGAGIEVLVPAGLTRTVTATAHVEPPPGAGDQPPTFDLATVCELTWRATIDGEPVSEAELSALAAGSRPLVRLRGEWVVMDPAVAAKLRRRDRLSATDTLAAALAGTATVDGEVIDVTVGGAAADLAERLRRAARPHELAEPDGLHATLRPYQRRGVAWMSEMVDLGLGGVLADDMGLGKTIQLIALHLHRSTLDAGPTLVVCPASLVGNWQRELARFAPDVTVHRYHGAERSLEGVGPGDVVVTTYGIVRRDTDDLAERSWGLVAADEAQQVKNPNSSTARALRRVPAAARLALTGTPVENRLTELWALLDWTTPGLLGSVESFRRTIAVPVERDRDPDTTERFARLVAPFLLRRRKDDPEVAPDLPPKTETDHPVVLTGEQASLYRAVVEEILEAIERAEGIARRGLVLKLLTALKQICNHPAQYLRQPGPLDARSGKLAAFDELVRAITDAGDATLVFTQYVAMGELLLARLAELGITAEFLHGSDSLTRRTAMVDRFQAGGFPVLVVSLKAGGTGLNLTRATHVIHYDRWWNPAVENQASDRVWRIGQDRPVQIHRLISEGTVEDRIATVLAQKQALADAVVGGGEAWLTELDDTELAALVRLGEERS